MRCWINIGWSIEKENLTKQEVRSRSGERIEELRNIGIESGSEDCWGRIFSWFRKYNLQR